MKKKQTARSPAQVDDSVFRTMVVAMGTTRARAIVDDIESKLKAIIFG